MPIIVNVNDTEFYHQYISPIGIITNKEELFKHTDKLKKLIPNLNWPIPNNYIITNMYCHSESGKRELFTNVCYPTYNNSDYQGYRHGAIDIGVYEYNYFNNKSNIIYNPFPFEVKAIVNDINYPEKDGAPEDYGKYGRYIDLVAPIEIPGINDQTGNITFKIRLAHLGEIYIKNNEIIKPNQKIAKVGFSGYTSFSGQHLHMEFLLFNTKIDPFVFAYDNKILNMISYIPGDADKYPSDYIIETPSSNFKSYISLNKDSKFTNTIEVTPGTYTFYLISKEKIKDVLMYSNPYGLIKEIKWNYNSFTYWVNKFINKLKNKKGIYLFDVCNYVHETKIINTYYKNNDTLEISKTYKDEYEKIIDEYWLYEINVTSVVPYDNNGYGIYTYFPISVNNTYGYKFNIILKEDKQ